MRSNKMILSFCLSVLLLTFSSSTFASTILKCTDASAPSTRGYFPKKVEIIDNGIMTVKYERAQLTAALTKESNLDGATGKVLETIVIGNTTNYVLEKDANGEQSVVLVADLEAKKAAIMYYGHATKLAMIQFLTCN